MVEYSPTVSKYYVDCVVDRLLSENNIIGSAGNLKITSFTISRSKKSIIFRTSEDDAALCDFTVEFHKIDIPGLYKTIVKYVKGKELFDYLFPGLYIYQPDGPEEQIQQLITFVIDERQCTYEEAVDTICQCVRASYNKSSRVVINDR